MDSEADRFDSEDWKHVVGDVKDARDDVVAAQADVTLARDSAVDAAEGD
ncbi:hypothetical protein [Sphingomonas psychrolutea]|nr:hypothetical protein [Sphingomonas psychrolutea]